MASPSTQSNGSGSGPIYDGETLRRSARGLTPPFRIAFDADGKRQLLECIQILRLLPAKRLVCFGRWKHSSPVVAKVYLDPRRARRHWRREARGIAVLQSAGIPTPEILHQGTLADDDGTPLLLTRWIPEARTLADALAAAGEERAAALLGSTVERLAQMHAAGISQGDVHPGNFLLAQDDILVIDGADVRRHGAGPLPHSPSIANLGLFLAQIYPAFDASMPELVSRYCRRRDWPFSHVFLQKVVKSIGRWSDWRERKFLQKSQRSCTAFAARKSWKRFTVCERERYTPAMVRVLRDPDAAMAAGTVLKAGNSTTVVKIDVDGRPLVVKRYNLKNLTHALRRMLRPSRARKSWRNANRLRLAEIATPHPLAFIEERWGPLRRRAYFITDLVPGESIAAVVARRRERLEQLAPYADHLRVLLENLRHMRISHGDLKASNLIIANGRLYLLDLDGMRKHSGGAGFKRAFRKDVHRLLANWSTDDAFRRLLMTRFEEIERIG